MGGGDPLGENWQGTLEARKRGGVRIYHPLLFRLVPSRPGLLVQAPFTLMAVLDPWQELSGPINLAFWGLCSM